METITIKAAVQAAEAFTKGAAEMPGLRSQDFEDAMLALAESRREQGENGAAAFARLTKARDPDLEVLWAACSLARVHEHHGHVLAKRGAAASNEKAQAVLKRAEANLDDYAAMHKQADETLEQAYGRLARDDAKFASLYGALDEVRRYVMG
ncbi:MAG: hypothetical protein AB7I09_19840 [Planctomycetota bacterium]